MTIVKELIVKFSAESIQDIPKDGAEKAFEKIGLDKCFTVEFQEIAELKRDQLNGNCDALIGEGNDDGMEAETQAENNGDNSSDEIDDQSESDAESEASLLTRSPAINVDSDDEDNFIGSQVGVKFDSRVDPGIITHYDPETQLFTVDFDDGVNLDDIKLTEIVFM